DANLQELERIKEIFGRRKHVAPIYSSDRASKLPITAWMQEQFLRQLTRPEEVRLRDEGPLPKERRPDFDHTARQKRQFERRVASTKKLMRDSENRRQEYFWTPVAKTLVGQWDTAMKPYRDHLWEEVIGKLPPPSKPVNPQTRAIYDEPKWKGYEVVLD